MENYLRIVMIVVFGAYGLIYIVMGIKDWRKRSVFDGVTEIVFGGFLVALSIVGIWLFTPVRKIVERGIDAEELKATRGTITYKGTFFGTCNYEAGRKRQTS